MHTTTRTRRPLSIPEPPPELLIPARPVVSVYLDAPGVLPAGLQERALRWRGLRERLGAEGAATEALAVVDQVLTAAQSVRDAAASRDALVVIASAQGPLYTAHLPESPAGDLALAGPLPHLTPLLAATQRLLPHIVVVTDRLGAELIVVKPDRLDLHAVVTGDRTFITKSAPGGWSQRRFQQRAENQWQANAGSVAETLTRLVDAHAPRLVVVSGDVRAVQFLRDQLPTRVSGLVREVQGEHADLAEALRRTEQVIAAQAETETEAVLEVYQRERGQRDLAAAGPAETLHALARGQVDVLLLDPTVTRQRRAWFGPLPHQVAETAQELRADGVPEPGQAPLEDVAVRAAFGTGASVRIAPPDNAALPHSGIAALLRYR